MDDWTALYVDGELKIQNHTLSSKEVLTAIGLEFESVNLEDNLEIGSILPETYEELEKLDDEKWIQLKL